MEIKKKEILKYLGIFVASLSFLGMIAHRFSQPDITDIRWLIDFWYIEILGLLLAGAGLFLWYKNTQ